MAPGSALVRMQMFWFWLCPPGRTHCLPQVAGAHPPRLLSLTELPAAVECGGRRAAGRLDLADEVGEEPNRRGQVKHVADQRPTRPWFAIGGVTLGRLDDALAAGATRVVVVRAITEAGDPAAATRAFEEKLAAVSPWRRGTRSGSEPADKTQYSRPATTRSHRRRDLTSYRLRPQVEPPAPLIRIRPVLREFVRQPRHHVPVSTHSTIPPDPPSNVR